MTDPYRQSLSVSWDEFHHLSRTLAGRLAELGPWRLLVAVTRGGLVPAAIVARELDLRVVDTLCIASYDGRAQGAARVLKAADAGDGEGVLVVDDLVDTGVTAAVMRRLLPKAHFATVFAKPQGRPLVDSVVSEVGQDTWIVLPWDQHPPIAGPSR
ncbi:xanthine phosphoribosyltransferase [Stella humosa]|uniref:Xanthine phosphoribosyltransferase n=1 Tax=Stella humosa TaxID=94 RepID=A0A3N1MIQ3_9PROT|nr:xanthine phosphoribosyltransferase [Stella humosa]ROQ03085.1 xanthine phosphoribosyltransferase [Stella humosa]BBK34234.1 xanthine phosphoribosyltransferase [Stella humosa]